MMMNRPTVPQLKCYKVTQEWAREKGDPPTIEDIARVLNTTVGSVKSWWDELEKKQWIARKTLPANPERYMARSVRCLKRLCKTDLKMIAAFEEKAA